MHLSGLLGTNKFRPVNRKWKIASFSCDPQWWSVNASAKFSAAGSLHRNTYGVANVRHNQHVALVVSSFVISAHRVSKSKISPNSGGLPACVVKLWEEKLIDCLTRRRVKSELEKRPFIRIELERDTAFVLNSVAITCACIWTSCNVHERRKFILHW